MNPTRQPRRRPPVDTRSTRRKTLAYLPAFAAPPMILLVALQFVTGAAAVPMLIVGLLLLPAGIMLNKHHLSRFLAITIVWTVASLLILFLVIAIGFASFVLN